ncbi:MAG: cytochrome P450 [Myxococcaceae bacterium]
MPNASPEEFQNAREAAGPPGVSLWQMLRGLEIDPLKRWTEIREEFGEVARYRYVFDDSYLLTSAEGVKRVLLDNAANYTKDHASYGMIRRIVGNGLLTSDGRFWLRQRRISQPAFHRERLAAMASQMVDAAKELRDGWGAKGPSPRVSMVQEMSGLTLRIVGAALFGSGLETEAATIGHSWDVLNTQLVERYNNMRLIPPVLPTRYDRTFRTARRTVFDKVQEIIAKKRAQPGENDLISMLIAARDEETGEGMTDAQLRDEVVTMLLAGHETTSLALSWSWALLHQHPEAETTLRQELETVLTGRLPTVEDLSRLRYTRAVIDESLRLYPPAYIMFRRATEDDVVSGHRLHRRGVTVITPLVLHRHPAYWPEPNSFRPERWLDAEEEKRRPRFAYLPFSAGPRQCIGNQFALMEAVLILATLAQRFRPRMVLGYALAPEYLVTLHPAAGLPMTLESVDAPHARVA